MNIKVNASEWSALTPEHQQQITTILQQTTLLAPGDEIVPDASIAPRAANAGPVAQPSGMFCTIACNIAEAAAVAACQLLPPPANGVCVVAAHAAGEICRKKC